MPYIARGNSGAIIAVFKEENECASEHVSPENRELQAVLGRVTFGAGTTLLIGGSRTDGLEVKLPITITAGLKL